MDDHFLTRLLRVEITAASGRGRRCPDESLLAAYVDGGLPGRERVRVEAHVADCAACLAQVSFLVRPHARSEDAVIARGVARARELVVAPSGQWRTFSWRWGAAAAGIACVVIVAAVQFGSPGAPSAPTSPRGPSPASAPPAQSAPVPGAAPPAVIPLAAPQEPPSASPGSPSRSLDAVRDAAAAPPSAVAIAVPRADAMLSPRDLAFRWRPVAGAIYYDVRLVTDEGTVVWQGQADGVDVRLPADLPLQDGGRYFVTVRAHLSGGGTLRSASVPFVIGR